ncbi:cytochrome c peroxidase [Candidatus Thiothrix sp. Deng01]|uniref:Cytochrome c peroxidase n=1 Tax=Candidatus Thiothrix phosphatis TaxID=3112415 RepID=A0ABU6CSJ6_9GAMM|nr:cytochrome c peroxidase [Candidatus Thiothrix sp. Deng01]MEB4589794.1 cytochrome c peroxidase [Candidatus Thiothrix sp. Deng01]
MQLQFFILICALTLLQGCNDERAASIYIPNNSSAPVLRSDLDSSLRELIQQYGLKGDPAQQLALPSIETPLAQLGMKLFFSKTLSGNLDVACATCHHPLLGGGDNLSLSIGVDAIDTDILGNKRMLQGNLTPGVPRNAPTTFNIGLWKQFMFHDGRVESTGSGITTPDVAYPLPDPLAGANLAHAQARFPVTSNHEMRGKTFDAGGTTQSCRERLAERLGGYGVGAGLLQPEETQYWLEQFRLAYQQPDAAAKQLITEQNIAAALSEYERSQIFTNNPWKQYVQGDLSAISESAKQGALLFFRKRGESGYDCASCHRGDFFTDEQFRNVLTPPIGPGKGNTDPAIQQDYGRWLVTHNPDDKFRFRTPSLLNVAVTGPWGHNGAFTALDGMVEHMLNPFQSAIHYNPAQLQQANVPSSHLQQNLREMLSCDTDIAGQEYRQEDVQLLLAFLNTLTDPCVTNPACMGKWTPSTDATQQDPQKLQLNATF